MFEKSGGKKGKGGYLNIEGGVLSFGSHIWDIGNFCHLLLFVIRILIILREYLNIQATMQLLLKCLVWYPSLFWCPQFLFGAKSLFLYHSLFSPLSAGISLSGHSGWGEFEFGF